MVTNITFNALLCLPDLLGGGTPANVVSRKLLDGGQFDLYAGMNMPMVIGFLNGVLLGEDVDYVEFGRSNLVHVNSLLTSSEDDEE